MRLLSYNIHKGVGGRDRRYRPERIIAVIERENPDLICLQEVVRHARRARNHDQPQMMAKYFCAQDWLYQMNVHYQQGGYGNLFLSRWPVVRHHQITLRQKQKKPRGAQLAVVDSPEGLLHIAHFHLGLAERERHWQIAHLLSHRLYLESANLPTLLVGDTNDWRNTLKNQKLATQGFRSLAHPASRFRTFPAWLPVGSLDKAYARNDITVRHIRVVRTRLAKQASDHLPLVVDFHLNA